MKLRGHHLICRLGFRGLGYDERFARTMEEVLTVFKWNPELNLKIVVDTDILCAACPNRKGDICYREENKRQDERVKEMDKLVISILEIDKGELYTLEEINYRIAEYFTEKDMKELCSSCKWKDYDYCKEGLAELKKEFEMGDLK